MLTLTQRQQCFVNYRFLSATPERAVERLIRFGDELIEPVAAMDCLHPAPISPLVRDVRCNSKEVSDRLFHLDLIAVAEQSNENVLYEIVCLGTRHSATVHQP